MTDTFDIGDRVRAEATFTVASVPTDGTVTAKVKDPNGTETTPSPSHPGVGDFYVDVDATLPGFWHVELKSTGAVVAAVRGKFYVRPNAFS